MNINIEHQKPSGPIPYLSAIDPLRIFCIKYERTFFICHDTAVPKRNEDFLYRILCGWMGFLNIFFCSVIVRWVQRMGIQIDFLYSEYSKMKKNCYGCYI